MSSRECINCGGGQAERSRGSAEKLCKPCMKKLKRVFCFFCQKHFHLLDRNKDAPPDRQWCSRCAQDHEICEYCKQTAAFTGTKCRHCETDEKKFGQPVPCSECHLVCAFKKSKEALDKVGGRYLCFACTIKYKIANKSSGEASESKRKSKKRPRDKTSDKHSKGKGSKDKKRRRKNSDSPSTDAKSSGPEGSPNGLSGPGGANANAGSSSSSSSSFGNPAGASFVDDESLRTLLEQYEDLHRLFSEHRDQAEKQMQEYIQKIIANRKQIDDLKAENSAVRKQLAEKQNELTGLRAAMVTEASASQGMVGKLRSENQAQQEHVRQLKQQLEKAQQDGGKATSGTRSGSSSSSGGGAGKGGGIILEM